MTRTITIDSPEAASTIVFLNGKPLRYWLTAQEGDPGWVEVIDHKTLDKQTEKTTETNLDLPEELELFPTIRIEGRVEFKSK